MSLCLLDYIFINQLQSLLRNLGFNHSLTHSLTGPPLRMILGTCGCITQRLKHGNVLSSQWLHIMGPPLALVIR